MTVTEALCVIEYGYSSKEYDEEIFKLAREIVWKESERIRLEYKLDRTKEKLAEMKRENND